MCGKGKISCVADLIFPDGHIENNVSRRFYEKDMPRFGDRVYVIAIPSSAGVIIVIQSEDKFLDAKNTIMKNLMKKNKNTRAVRML